MRHLGKYRSTNKYLLRVLLIVILYLVILLAFIRVDVRASAPGLNEDDYVLLCKIIAAEARGEGLEGMKAVAQVIRDRMEHDNTKMYGGPTLRGVVLKRGQFAKPWSGDYTQYPEIMEAIEAVFINGERVFEEVVTFFYYPKYSTTRGAASIKRYNFVGQVGVHHFHGDQKGGAESDCRANEKLDKETIPICEMGEDGRMYVRRAGSGLILHIHEPW